MKTIKGIYLKYKIILLPLISAISFVVILTLVVIPQLLAYLNIRKELAEIQNRSNTLQVKADELENINEAETQKNLQIVFTILPRDQDVLQSLSILQDTIAKSGLGLQDTAFSSSRLGDQASNNFQLNIKIIGQLAAIRNFLVKLQDAPQIFRIESISAQFTTGGSLIEATIPISVFYENLPKTIESKDLTLQLSDEEQHLLSQLSRLVSQTPIGGETDFSYIQLGKPDPFE